MLRSYKRQFVSFTGKCPYQCNHCYTFCSAYDSYDSGNSVNEIIEGLRKEDFDIVYVSGHKENFINPDDGIELCEQIFQNYSSDIMITTRNVFDCKQLEKISILNRKMEEKHRDLFFCASIPALQSYKKLEPNPIIPNPIKRIENLKRIFDLGIYTVLTLRPLCPNIYIPIQEIIDIIELCQQHVSVVLSSGIVVNDEILHKLIGFPKDFNCQEKPLMPCLKNNLSMRYVDVNMELKEIKIKCKEYSLPFFEHSLPAIEYLKKQKNFSNEIRNQSN